jgi:hypothetical protein
MTDRWSSRSWAPARPAACRAPTAIGAIAIRPNRRTCAPAARCWCAGQGRAIDRRRDHGRRRHLAGLPAAGGEGGVKRVDACLFTHDHADQAHGIDDLRPFFLNARKRVPTYMDAYTPRAWGGASTTSSRAGAAIRPSATPHPSRRTARPGDRRPQRRDPGPTFDVDHGEIRAVGYRFGDVAYTPDAIGFPRRAGRRWRSGRLGRRRPALDAASDPRPCRPGPGMDRPRQAAPRHPDQPAYRSGFQRLGGETSARRRAGL